MVNQYCAHSFARNWQLPFLNQQKGENDRRKYFMINLHERMLPTSAGVEPATSWSPVGRRIQLSQRGQPLIVLNTYKAKYRVTCLKNLGGYMRYSFMYLTSATSSPLQFKLQIHRYVHRIWHAKWEVRSMGALKWLVKKSMKKYENENKFLYHIKDKTVNQWKQHGRSKDTKQKEKKTWTNLWITEDFVKEAYLVIILG